MLKSTLCAALLAASMITATPVAAQVIPTGPTTNRLNVTFTGTVTNDVTNQIRIRQPNGTTALYQGPVPEYPYRQGDTVSISFQTDVPNRNFYNSPAYTGQVSADGLYRIRVTSPGTGSSSGPGFTNRLDVSGPITQESVPLRLSGLTLVYDSDADTYSLELPTGTWFASSFDAPSYSYDARTGALISSPTACTGVQCEDAGLVIRGTQDSVTINDGFGRGIPIGGTDSTGAPSLLGFLDGLNLSGVFNFPIFGSGGGGGGGPIDVPEPSMILLFGGAAGAVIRRRRKKAVT